MSVQELRDSACDRLHEILEQHEETTARLMLMEGGAITHGEYFRLMRSTEWADDPVISALALTLGCAIVIYDTANGSHHRVESEARNEEHVIEVAWVNAGGVGPLNHFELISPTEERLVTPPGSPSAL
mmetsp:Transcript_18188/g.36749  ORF Transcript_18188/g.36749 Transcript_18188/m.36749 type:complete len:128 (-) Transcript_18188:3006-3389(-)